MHDKTGLVTEFIGERFGWCCIYFTLKFDNIINYVPRFIHTKSIKIKH